jgi:protein-tyrosine phosphatase
VVHAPIDDPEDAAFWGRFPAGADATPLFYRDYVERKPERAAQAVAGIARARPGGVLVHCAGGRDRTGLVTMVLLRWLEVPDEEIIADFVHSYRRMVPLWAALGEPDNGLAVRDFLAALGTTPEAEMQAALDGLDAGAVLRAGGLADTDFEALRIRLLD